MRVHITEPIARGGTCGEIERSPEIYVSSYFARGEWGGNLGSSILCAIPANMFVVLTLPVYARMTGCMRRRTEGKLSAAAS